MPNLDTYRFLNRSVSEWRALGQTKLDLQANRARRLMTYYEGEPTGIALSGSQRDIFRRLLKESRANWSELIVNAVAERLAVTAFSFKDDPTDDLAWFVWQANQMDADSETVQTDSLVCGHTFVSVWPDEENPSGVSIYPEHPLEVTTFYRPPNRRDAVVAYKAFQNDWGDRVEVLVFPDVVVTSEGTAETTMEPNEMGTVPYEEIVPAPRTIGPGRSELHSVIPFQDRINTTVYNRLVASDFGAFRQVTATGISLQRDDTGAYAAPFDVGADRLLASENESASFGVIPESSLGGYLNAEALDVQHLAAITQTPPHYLLGQMTNISAAGMKAAETGLVAKTARRAGHIGEGWERVMRRALSYLGNPGAVDVTAEVIWKDFENRSEGETVDALTKMATLGVPLEVLWARWGASPQDIKRWNEMAPPPQLKPDPTLAPPTVVPSVPAPAPPPPPTP